MGTVNGYRIFFNYIIYLYIVVPKYLIDMYMVSETDITVVSLSLCFSVQLGKLMGTWVPDPKSPVKC